MNFLGCDREQTFLLPPSLDEWLPDDHFARFVIAAVEEMDLSGFYADYRADGHGRPAHDPAMMVALLVYAYARGQRSSRVIERGCFEDIAMRFIAANRQPDHTTIARFRQRHERALAELFGQVLGLCAQAGLAGVAVLAVDGTKVHANASERATRDYEQLAEEALNEAGEVDAAEDAQFAERRGDELPGELATAQGRKKWLEAARRRLEAEREVEARPIAQSRPARVREAKRRLEEELATEVRANDAYEAYRAQGRMKNGRRFGSPPKPYTPPEQPTGKINVTDPDSRTLKTPRGFVQGYNAQAVCNEQQIVVAAEVSVSSADFGQMGPMIDKARAELAAAGVTDQPGVVLADAGYWHGHQIDSLMGEVSVSFRNLLSVPASTLVAVAEVSRSHLSSSTSRRPCGIRGSCSGRKASITVVLALRASRYLSNSDKKPSPAFIDVGSSADASGVLARAASAAASPFSDAGADDDDVGIRLARAWRRIDPGSLGGDAIEIALEPSRGADQQVAGWGIAEICESVVGPTRREHHAPAVAPKQLLAKLKGELTVEHVEGLIEVVVVKWRPLPMSRNGALDHGNLIGGLLAA